MKLYIATFRNSSENPGVWEGIYLASSWKSAYKKARRDKPKNGKLLSVKLV